MAEMSDINSDLEAGFQDAASHLRKSLVGKLEANQLLSLYALYKQATEGICPPEKPRWYEFQAKQKWEAWQSLGNMDREKAMSEYIRHVEEFDPKWEKKVLGLDSDGKDQTSEGWVTVSCLPNTDEVIKDCDKTIFDWVKEGKIQQVRDMITSKSGDVNAVDHEGMGLIHWAADRGNMQMLQVLVEEFNANVNLQDQEGQTALHYAASCSHSSVIQYLLEKNVNQSIADVYGMLPVHVASSIEICSLFKNPEN